jgi:predicted permease
VPSLRHLLRFVTLRPGFSFLAAFSLALGIGLVATQFSLVDGILLRGLPAPDAQRIMHVSYRDAQNPDSAYWGPAPFRDFLALREQQTSLESLAGMSQLGLNLTGEGRIPSHHAGALTTANFPGVLGAQPMLGRWFTAEEDRPGQPLRVVLSHKLWQEEFGADPQVLGRPLAVNGTPGTIIGVMPARFSFPGNTLLWINLRAEPNDPRTRPIDRVEMIGKLRPDVPLEQARAEFNGLAARFEKLWPETNTGYTRMNVQKITYAYAAGGTDNLVFIMLAMAVFILALGCVNVANMLLGRAAQRTRELAVRAAVGASRGRLIRQLLVEALTLAGLGALGGLFLARYGVDLLQEYLANQPYVPGWFDFRLDYRVVAVAIAVTLVAGVVAGIMPALQASRLDVNTALKDDARAAAGMGMGRISRWLVTAQIAVSSALLIAACVLGWTVYETRQANLRYDPDRLLTGRVELHDTTHPTAELRARFYRQLVTQLENQPGIEAVAVTSRNFVGPGVGTEVAPEGVVYAHDNERPRVYLEVVSAGYFRLVGVRALAGRLFDEREHNAKGRVSVVNEPFARRFWPGQDPIGKRFRSNQTQDEWVTVIGVVPNLQMGGLFQPPDFDPAGFYLSQDQMGWGWLDLFIRTKADPTAMIAPMRHAIAALDPNQPIHSIGTLTSVTAQAVRGYSIIGVMAGIFAAITLFLGAVGVYGVTSLAVSRRVREFGVRLALGASVAQVLALVVRQGARQIGVGLSLGLGGGFLLTRPLASIVGGDTMNNPLLYAAVGLLIAGVAFTALWLPARRATRVDPIEALRSE